VAGYGNGPNIAPIAAWNRFPGIPHVVIDVTGAIPQAADVLDVETGDASPAESYVWLKQKIARGDSMPTVYCNRSTQPQVEIATKELIHGKDYFFWIATLDGTVKLPDMTGVVAIQDKSAAQTHAHYDESIVYSDVWHRSLIVTSGIVVFGNPLTSKSVTSSDGKTWH
jgi:hypothetical protein